MRDGLAPSFAPGTLPLGPGTVTATLGDAAVTVHAVHPYPPLPGAEGRWRADLAGLRHACAAPRPRSLEVLDVPGGDHRAVLATVTLPGS